MTIATIIPNPAELMKDLKRVPILFIDLDGTVRKGFDELGRFVNTPADVEIFPHVVNRLLSYKQRGWRIVAVTNQGGVALGHLTFENMANALVLTLKLCGGIFDCVYACMHHPDAFDPEMRECYCRKPRIGSLVMATIELIRLHPDEQYPSHMALMVGDREEDRQCALNAGIKFMWAKDWRQEPYTLTLEEPEQP